MYLAKERQRLGLNKGQAALLIMDVLIGQMMDPVLKVLSNNNILLQIVPVNFTYLFQLFDVQGGPHGSVKRLMEKKFSEWYPVKITHAMSDS